MSVEMYASHTDALTLPRIGAPGDRGNAGRAVDEIDGVVCTLQCMSSGYLSGGRRCDCVIPETIVAAAWQQELERGWTRGEGFFRLTWHEQQWLAYGRDDGSVRGVYCPTHGAERDQRAFAAITGGAAGTPAVHAHA